MSYWAASRQWTQGVGYWSNTSMLAVHLLCDVIAYSVIFSTRAYEESNVDALADDVPRILNIVTLSPAAYEQARSQYTAIQCDIDPRDAGIKVSPVVLSGLHQLTTTQDGAIALAIGLCIYYVERHFPITKLHEKIWRRQWCPIFPFRDIDEKLLSLLLLMWDDITARDGRWNITRLLERMQSSMPHLAPFSLRKPLERSYQFLEESQRAETLRLVVLRITDGRLPAELSDEIYEYLLDSHSIPHPKLYKAIWVPEYPIPKCWSGLCDQAATCPNGLIARWNPQERTFRHYHASAPLPCRRQPCTGHHDT